MKLDIILIISKYQFGSFATLLSLSQQTIPSNNIQGSVKIRKKWVIFRKNSQRMKTSHHFCNGNKIQKNFLKRVQPQAIVGKSSKWWKIQSMKSLWELALMSVVNWDLTRKNYRRKTKRRPIRNGCLSRKSLAQKISFRGWLWTISRSWYANTKRRYVSLNLLPFILCMMLILSFLVNLTVTPKVETQ